MQIFPSCPLRNALTNWVAIASVSGILTSWPKKGVQIVSTNLAFLWENTVKMAKPYFVAIIGLGWCNQELQDIILWTLHFHELNIIKGSTFVELVENVVSNVDDPDLLVPQWGWKMDKSATRKGLKLFGKISEVSTYRKKPISCQFPSSWCLASWCPEYPEERWAGCQIHVFSFAELSSRRA